MCLALLDSIAILVAVLLATWIRNGTLEAVVAFEGPGVEVKFWQLALVIVPLWILMLSWSGLYEYERLSWGVSELGRAARAVSLGVVVLVVLTYVAKMPGLSRVWTIMLWVFSVAFVLLGRAVYSIVVMVLRRKGVGEIPTLIVGANSESSDIIRILRANPAAGLVPVGCLLSVQSERLNLDYCSGDVPVLGIAREIRECVRSSGVEAVIIASSAFDHDVLARMIAELRDEDVDVHVSSGLFEVLTSRVQVSEIAGVPLITVRGLSLTKMNLLTKRAFDVVIASSVAIVGLPLWALIALAIRVDSPGDVFYSQKRVGRDGASFKMLKFRSMYVDAESRLAELRGFNEASGALFKMHDDPRITRVGRWLRKFSLDEFPQIINVLKGEMSLVGPRPPLPSEVGRYTEHDWRRLEVVPGMTGLWQVSGRSGLTFDEMVRLDIFYIENWSIGLDLTLLSRTLPAVLLARGAY